MCGRRVRALTLRSHSPYARLDTTNEETGVRINERELVDWNNISIRKDGRLLKKNESSFWSSLLADEIDDDRSGQIAKSGQSADRHRSHSRAATGTAALHLFGASVERDHYFDTNRYSRPCRSPHRDNQTPDTVHKRVSDPCRAAPHRRQYSKSQ